MIRKISNLYKFIPSIYPSLLAFFFNIGLANCTFTRREKKKKEMKKKILEFLSLSWVSQTRRERKIPSNPPGKKKNLPSNIHMITDYIPTL